MSKCSSGIIVYKMTGSGNDFVFADGRTNPVGEWDARLIRQLCDRRHGIGADGFAVVEPGSAPGRIRFHFFNSDGSPAPMCGNGALCATRVAWWLELSDSREMVLETGAGDMRTRVIDGDEQRAELQMKATIEVEEPDVDLRPGETSVHFLTVGVPHVVVVTEDVQAVQVADRGRELRRHEAFAPGGTNVNFVSRRPDGSWRMRTYERGVEAETLACGTGATACAGVLLKLGEISLPWVVHTASNRVLAISGTVSRSRVLSDPRIEGEARIVFRALVV